METAFYFAIHYNILLYITTINMAYLQEHDESTLDGIRSAHKARSVEDEQSFCHFYDASV